MFKTARNRPFFCGMTRRRFKQPAVSAQNNQGVSRIWHEDKAVWDVFAPQGLQDSAQGFNPGKTSKKSGSP